MVLTQRLGRAASTMTARSATVPPAVGSEKICGRHPHGPGEDLYCSVNGSWGLAVRTADSPARREPLPKEGFSGVPTVSSDAIRSGGRI